jgi:hypothetical protein
MVNSSMAYCASSKLFTLVDYMKLLDLLIYTVAYTDIIFEVFDLPLGLFCF